VNLPAKSSDKTYVKSGLRSGRFGTEARKLAAAVLEVLAGARTPAEAAADVGVSLPRYYQLEVRALDGLVAACESRPKGKKRSVESQAAQAQRETARLKRECDRLRALVRLAGRTIGLAAPEAAKAKTPPGVKRRKRRVVRALRTAERLRTETPETPPPA
jgi:hypothetical protein